MLRWWTLAQDFHTWLSRANGREIAPGISLKFESDEMGGFPFRLDTVINKISLEAKCARTALSWHAERFAIHRLTYGRDQAIFEAAGVQTVTWIDARGATHRFAFTPGSMRASAILSGRALARFDFDIEGFGSHDVSGERAQLHFRRSALGNALDVAASADALRLASGAGISRFDLAGILEPADSLSPLLAGGGPWCTSAEAWRRRGGAFHVDTFNVAWDGMSALGAGRFMLDALHRPAGALRLKVAHSDHFSVSAGSNILDALARLAHSSSGAGTVADVGARFGNGVVRFGRPSSGETANAGVLGALY
jgi:hypothetical protein